MARKDYVPLKERALARALRVPEDEYDAFHEALRRLGADGNVVVGSKSGIALPQMSKRVVGIFQSTSRGFGFVKPDTPNAHGDLFIPAPDTLDAVSGDTVVARVVKKGKRDGQMRLYGRIVEVLERGQTEVAGTLFRQERQWFVQPDGKAMNEAIAVDDPSAKDAREGDKVRVEIMQFPNAKCFANGVILEKLGRSGTAEAELKAVICQYDLTDAFSKTTLREARDRAADFDAQKALDAGQREDARDAVIITVDPVDARDFDDAISLVRRDNGDWVLGVHIADVSHFVTPGSHLDDEARDRGTSVYLPRHVIPMLPEQLSNGVCSLQEAQDRLAKSAYITLDPEGQVLHTRFAASVIRSHRRLTYEDADLILDGKTGGFDSQTVELVRKMQELAQVILERRREAGMLSLDLPDAELVYDDQGQVVDAHPESNTFSHRIIEMFMIEANEAVARLLDSLRVSFLRRVHPAPDALGIGDAARVVKLCGYVLPKDIDRKGMQQLLESAAGKPEAFLINLAILKSMQRAEYSPAPMGHYALASEYYCHFTSPIRRYPDLLIHRLLQAYLDGDLTAKNGPEFLDYGDMQSLGQHCTDRERNAEDAERELKRVKLLQLLEKHVGDRLPGVVTSITNFGVFVQLEKFLVDGLIRAEDVPTGDLPRRGRGGRPKPLAGKGFAERCLYRIGDEIEVCIADVNVPGRCLDLVPA